MLFGDAEPEVVGFGDPIGIVTKNGGGDAWLSQMMAAAGITESKEKGE